MQRVSFGMAITYTFGPSSPIATIHSGRVGRVHMSRCVRGSDSERRRHARQLDMDQVQWATGPVG